MPTNRFAPHRPRRWIPSFILLGLVTSTAIAAPKMKAADKVPPSILHAPMSATIAGSPVRIEARFNDPSGVLAPSLVWRLSGQKAWTTVEMSQVRGDLYEVTLAASAVKGDFDYYLEAFDNLGNGPARAGSPELPITVALQKEAPAAASAVIRAPAIAAPAPVPPASSEAIAMPAAAPTPAAAPAPVIMAVPPPVTAQPSRPARVLPMVWPRAALR